MIKKIFFSLFFLVYSPHIYASHKPSIFGNNSQKKALIIGNEDYSNREEKLQNPVKDALALSEKLSTFGFNVDSTYTNLNSINLKYRINNFIRTIQDNDIVIFYFSGHGIEDNGENLLIPIDTNSISDIESLHNNSYKLRTFLSKVKDVKAKIIIVILDACRTNPYIKKISGSKGGLGLTKTIMRSRKKNIEFLNQKEDVYVSNLLIGYATAPNSEADDGIWGKRHSPYTQILLDSLDKYSNEKILEFFNQVSLGVKNLTEGKQIPWNTNSGVPQFCFGGCYNNNGDNNNYSSIYNLNNNIWQDVKENKSKKLNFEDANRYCRELKDNNYNWRLPTKKELEILYLNRSNLNYNSNLEYWSSTFLDNTDNLIAHTVCFSRECIDNNLGSSVNKNHYVRCIAK